MKTVPPFKVRAGLPWLAGLGAVWATVSQTGLAADTLSLPDAEKARLLAGQSVIAVAASADGRLIAALSKDTDNASSQVWIFDAYSSRGYAESYDEPENPVSVACSDPVGVYVGQGDSSYVVQIPCGESDDGSVYQFTVAVNDDASSALPFSIGTVSPTDGLTTVSAATLSTDGTTLYLAGLNSSGARVLVSIDATSAGADPVTLGSFQYLSAEIKVLAENEAGDDVVAVDTTGAVYVAYGEQINGSGVVTCVTSPRSLVVASQSEAVLIGDDDEVRVISLLSHEAIACEAYDWGLTSPRAVARQLVGGSDSPVDALYIRASGESGDEIAVFDTDAALSDPDNAAAEFPILTDSSLGTDDTLASSGLPRVYLGTSDGVSVVAAGPWLTLSVDSEPVGLVDDDLIFSLSVTSDEESDSVWFDLAEPLDSSVTNGQPLDGLVAGTAADLEVDASKLDDLVVGANTLFVYALDADGNLGWAAVRVNYVETPEAVTGLDVGFGNGALYVSFDKPDDDAVDDYELLISTESFTAPGEDEDIPVGWTVSSPAFTVDGVAYPGDDGWPMSLSYSSDSSSWTESDGVLTYTLSPLANGTTYYMSIRAVTEGEAGPWSEVASGVPQLTCGAECLTEGAGGFCSMVPVTSSRPPGRWTFPAAVWMMSIGWVLRWRRRIG